MRIVLMIVLFVAIAAAVSSQDFNKGAAAYHNGDYATALKEWKPLAEQGDVRAQLILGIMYSYSNGIGVPQDSKEAVKWYRLAAEQGDALAQFNLGIMYGAGQGVLQDNVLAHMWFNVSAANGSDVGGKNRDKLAKEMTPSAIEKAQAMARKCMNSDYQDCGY